MAYKDEDFILRQTKELAAGLGKFLGKSEVEEILNFGEKQADDQAKNEPKQKRVKPPSEETEQ